MDESEPPDEPEAWTRELLDPDFVDGARVREPSAAERTAAAARLHSSAALRQRLDEEEALEEAQYRATRRRNRRRRVTGVIVIVAMFATMFGFIIRNLGETPATESAADIGPGFEPDRSPLGGGDSGTGRPTPGFGSENQPLNEPPPIPRKSGKYEFIETQPDADRPVTYDPCRAIRYVVNSEAEPSGGAQLLESALERLSEVTGLTFINDGPTDESTNNDRSPFQPDRYGDRWAPVLIWWAAPDSARLLRGAVAGFAGSSWLTTNDPLRGESSVYVSGAVVLDGPQLAKAIDAPGDGEGGSRAVILHELGHLVGLGHVDDPTQLMYPQTSPEVVDLAAGDLRGLHELGIGECRPDI